MSFINRSPRWHSTRHGSWHSISRPIITPLSTTKYIASTAVVTAIRIFATRAACPIARRLNPCTARSTTHSHRSTNEALCTSSQMPLVLLATTRVLPLAIHRKLRAITTAAIMLRRTKFPVAAGSHTLSGCIPAKPSILPMRHSSEPESSHRSYPRCRPGASQ